MSLAEITGSPRYNTYVAPKVNIPSPAYTAAVTQVRTASKGTVISRAEQTQIKPDITNKIVNVVTNPVFGGLEVAQDFINAVVGTRETKAVIASEYIGGTVKITPAYDIARPSAEPVIISTSDLMQKTITEQKESDPKLKEFWEQNTLGGSDIQLPSIPEIKIPEFKLFDFDFGSIGNTLKWVAIGGAALIGLYFVSKILGGKR
jgi:hypothetical protein